MAVEEKDSESEEVEEPDEAEDDSPPEKPKEPKFTRRDVRREVKKAVRALREQEDEKELELLESDDAWAEGRRQRKLEEKIARLERSGSSGVGEVVIVALLAVVGIGFAFWDTIRERLNLHNQ